MSTPSDQVITDARARIARHLAPVSAGEQQDLTYDETFEELKSEVAKDASVSGGSCDWETVCSIAEELLEDKSKDLRVACYLAVGMIREGGLDNLLDALALLEQLVREHWDSMYPAVARLRARCAIVSWMSEQTAPLVAEIHVEADDRVAVEAVDSLSRALDAFLSERCGSKYDGIGGLRSSIRRLEQLCPKAATGNKSSRSSGKKRPNRKRRGRKDSDQDGAATEDLLAASQERIKSLLEPIKGGTGQDISYDDTFEELMAEIKKLGRVNGGSCDWELVESLSREILEERSKDLRVAGYLATAMMREGTLEGVVDGLRLVDQLARKYWDTMFPPARRMRARTAIISFINDVGGPAIAHTEVSTSDKPSVAAADELRKKLDAYLREQIGDAYPGLAQLRSALQQLLTKCEPSATQAVVADPFAADAQQDTVTALDEDDPFGSRKPSEPQADPFADDDDPFGTAAPSQPQQDPFGTTDDDPFGSRRPSAPPEDPSADDEDPFGTSAPSQPQADPFGSDDDPFGSRSASDDDTVDMSALDTPVLDAPGPQLGSATARAAAGAINSLEDVDKCLPASRERLLEMARVVHDSKLDSALAYRLARAGMWLGLTLPAEQDGVTEIEPPSEPLRQDLERLLDKQDWLELLRQAEQAAREHPYWLDANRWVVVAMEHLGAGYTRARYECLRELALLTLRHPDLQTLCFADGSPIASAATRLWLETEVQPCGSSLPGAPLPPLQVIAESTLEEATGKARALIARGQVAAGLALVGRATAGASSPIQRFNAQLATAKLCLEAGEAAIACAHLEGLSERIAEHSLETWDPALCAEVFETLYRAHRDKNSDAVVSPAEKAREKQVFEQLCRIDMPAALRLAGNSKRSVVPNRANKAS